MNRELNSDAEIGYAYTRKITGLVIYVFILCSCSFLKPAQATYHVPEQTDDGWETASLEAVGMDARRMEDFMNDLANYSDHWVHGVIVIKEGKLVFEEYFPGRDLDLSHLGNGLVYTTRNFDRDTLHSVTSVSKSVTSILMGIAIDKGLIQGTQETLFSYFPDYGQFSDPTTRQITLEHMLTMTSGLPWSEAYPYDDPRNDLAAMVSSDDPIGYPLNKAIVSTPGTEFIYNSGTINLLGEVIKRASGMTLANFAEQHLFAPLSIESYRWYSFPKSPQMAVASSTLYFRPRDMAKIGQLVLDGGVWKGTRVVSEAWVTRFTQRSIDIVADENPLPILDPGYGFLWWLGSFPARNTETCFAAGYGGQFIFVIPELKMVVVFTAGGFENRNYDALLQIMNQYILPAAGQNDVEEH